VTVLRASGIASVTGLVVFALAPTATLAGVGIVLWGAGAALAVPVGIAAASDDPVRAAGRVAVVSAFASIASLVAPSVIGLAAEQVGARRALLVVVVTMLVSLAVARTVGPQAADAPGRRGTAPVPGADPAAPPTGTSGAGTSGAGVPAAASAGSAALAVPAGPAAGRAAGATLDPVHGPGAAPAAVAPAVGTEACVDDTAPRTGPRRARGARPGPERPRRTSRRTLRGGAR
jgi:hypothetical protein